MTAEQIQTALRLIQGCVGVGSESWQVSVELQVIGDVCDFVTGNALDFIDAVLDADPKVDV